MTDEQETAGGQPATAQGCLCREVLDNLSKLFEISPNVRVHLANSRIEFLKAIRAAIDQRIDHISAKTQQGSHIPVE
ncbi:MAG TPA: hypothetical protein VEJ67_05825 [Candidatus Cybelea sp.]|nr:hypothetical protein [Candidatus Cybelea sp.]